MEQNTDARDMQEQEEEREREDDEKAWAAPLRVLAALQMLLGVHVALVSPLVASAPRCIP